MQGNTHAKNMENGNCVENCLKNSVCEKRNSLQNWSSWRRQQTSEEQREKLQQSCSLLQTLSKAKKAEEEKLARELKQREEQQRKLRDNQVWTNWRSAVSTAKQRAHVQQRCHLLRTMSEQKEAEENASINVETRQNPRKGKVLRRKSTGMLSNQA